MEVYYPKAVKNLKVNDRVICVASINRFTYMTKGTVRYVGIPMKFKQKVYGVEFDKNVRSKQNTKVYFKSTNGFGMFMKLNELRKFTKNFNIKNFQKYHEEELQKAEEVTEQIIEQKKEVEEKSEVKVEEEKSEEKKEEKTPEITIELEEEKEVSEKDESEIESEKKTDNIIRNDEEESQKL